jgi:hypothetical protein
MNPLPRSVSSALQEIAAALNDLCRLTVAVLGDDPFGRESCRLLYCPKIEIVAELRAALDIQHAVFDHDGTLDRAS